MDIKRARELLGKEFDYIPDVTINYLMMYCEIIAKLVMEKTYRDDEEEKKKKK